MRICAIILNYYGFRDTAECVESLLGEDPPERIVVVENSANQKEQGNIERRFSDRSRITILCPGRNLGFAGGVDFAVRSIGIGAFDAFLILNNDTLVPPGTVGCLEQELRSGDFDFVAPVIYRYPETGLIWSKGVYYNRYTGLVSHHRLGFLPGNFYYLTGCCLLIPSAVLETVGLFDEAFFMYGEDVEFCFRAAKQGLKYGLAAKARIFHKGSGSSGNNSLFYENHMNRSHLLLCSKLAHTPEEARMIRVMKLIMMSLRAIWRVLRYGNLRSLQGLRLAMSGVRSQREVFFEHAMSEKAE